MDVAPSNRGVNAKVLDDRGKYLYIALKFYEMIAEGSRALLTQEYVRKYLQN